MDLLRGVAVLLIVAYHVLAVPPLFGGDAANVWAARVNEALSPFRIPTLLVLSGLLLERSLAKGRVQFLDGKVRQILWPYALWCIPLALLGPDPASIGSVWFWVGGNIVWYLFVIFVCYLLALLRPRWCPWGLCAVAPLLLLWIVDPSTNAYIRILWFGGFFFLGAALQRWLLRMQAMSTMVAGPVAVLAFLGGIAVAGDWIQDQTPLFLLVSCLGILVALWAAPRVCEAADLRLLEWYGRNSIVVYVGHAVGMFATMTFLESLGWERSAIVPFALALVGFGLPTALIALRPRIAWMFALPRFHQAAPPAGKGSVE